MKGTRGHSFCKGCIDAAKKNNISCPGDCLGKCGKKFVKNPLPNTTLGKTIIYCPTRGDGGGENIEPAAAAGSSGGYGWPDVKKPKRDCCQWTGTFDGAQQHFLTCDFVGVSCPHNGCGIVVARRDLQAHRESCVHRQILCGWGCGFHATRSPLNHHELFTCELRQMPCPNFGRGCGLGVIRANAVDAHLPCPFAGVGCNARLLRKDMEMHERDATAMVHHNRMLMSSLTKHHKKHDESVQELQDKVEQQGEVIEAQKVRIDELQRTLDLVATGSVLVLQIEHGKLMASLLGTTDDDAVEQTEVTRVAGRAFKMEVVASSEDDEFTVWLDMEEGPTPCKVKCTAELVYHGDDEDSAVQENSTSTVHFHTTCFRVLTVAKDKLFDKDDSFYVDEDGMVTFKCTFEVVAYP